MPALDDPSHQRHTLWTEAQDSVAGACSFCSTAFGAKSGVEATGVALLDDFDEHKSLRGYVERGFTILTF